MGIRLRPKDPNVLTIDHINVTMSKHYYEFDLETGMEVEFDIDKKMSIKRYNPLKNTIDK